VLEVEYLFTGGARVGSGARVGGGLVLEMWVDVGGVGVGEIG